MLTINRSPVGHLSRLFPGCHLDRFRATLSLRRGVRRSRKIPRIRPPRCRFREFSRCRLAPPFRSASANCHLLIASVRRIGPVALLLWRDNNHHQDQHHQESSIDGKAAAGRGRPPEQDEPDTAANALYKAQQDRSDFGWSDFDPRAWPLFARGFYRGDNAVVPRKAKRNRRRPLPLGASRKACQRSL